MVMICPYCDIEINEKLIEAEDGCCPECGALITASTVINEDEEDYLDEDGDDDSSYHDDIGGDDFGDEFGDLDDDDFKDDRY